MTANSMANDDEARRLIEDWSSEIRAVLENLRDTFARLAELLEDLEDDDE